MINNEMFHPISMDDKSWIQEILKNEYLEICDQTFGMSYVGKYTYNIQVANICDCVVYRYDEGDFHSFSYPIGKKSKEAVLELIDHIRNSEENIIICPIPFSQRQELMSLNIDDLIIESTSDYYDYVYLAEDLLTLKGSKYSAKRNHINRFIESNNWSYEPLRKDNAMECLQLVSNWRQTKDDSKDEELLAEELEIKRSLEKLDELGFFGSVIRVDEKIVAFSICEKQNDDTIIVHYEKADAEIQGAYQIINKETVAHADNISFKFVNREDDLGILGLRKAKLSYYPYYMGRKYGAYISNVSFANENDINELKVLWKKAFNDEDDYINSYFNYLMDENAIGQKWLNESILVIRKNGHIAAMGSVYSSVLDGEDVKYIYGLATSEEFRGQGMCKEIIRFAKEYYTCPLVLKPGDESLRVMYNKIGFKDLNSEARLILTDEVFTRSSLELIDECDYTEGLMIYA